MAARWISPDRTRPNRAPWSKRFRDWQPRRRRHNAQGAEFMIDLKLTRLAAPLCLAISLGACAANQEWASPQTGIKATEADIAQCEIAARNEAWRSGSAVDSFTAARYA